MTHSSVIGPAAMLLARSDKAPLFLGDPGDFKDFLSDYEDLADAHHLSDSQRSHTIIKYIPSELRDLWRLQKGFNTSAWDTFKGKLFILYPDDTTVQRYTKQQLWKLVHEAARYHMCDACDVAEYYCRFLTIAGPLLHKRKLTVDDRDEQFWDGFHPKDQDCLESRLFASHPHHNTTTPYDFQVVYEAARVLFSQARFNRRGRNFNVSPPEMDSGDEEAPSRTREHFFDRVADGGHHARRLSTDASHRCRTRDSSALNDH